ncbi:outer membrane protein OmpV [Vibrio mimicus]|uniref:outer membrane protein OmpV n=1 Tax=Vibrio mimicus TaxID=674 RepID=UPI0002B96101|nr:MipA/OmpV family protein [Vibrio mimicus]EMB49687.1 outer membrane protein OmpV [Vibrio mimicus CAIM 602]MBY7673031.1 MipA/OmpV family protein [Vibrio mimicus]MBY7725193.1 MipA/OmpV family protein [Vibrio mimicus]TXY12710.1 MipA/OmpV family protein [Vibrio mimicus]TXY32020.1 MipA/OmpV family protein [Vibrio mimicus]
MNKIALLITTSLIAGHAFAAQTYIRNGNIYTHEGQWVVEAGGFGSSDLLKDQDKSYGALLNFGYHGEDFNADLAGINYRFFGQTGDILNLSTYLTGSGLSYDQDSAKSVKGMDKRNATVDLGVNADIALGDGTVSTYFQHDIFNEHKGYKTGVNYFHIVEMGSVDFVPFAGVSYQNSDYNNYYFGVKDKEATAQRKAYRAGGDFSYNLGYKLVYPINDRWEVTQTSTYTRLGSDIAHSPIVESANQWLVGATVAYHF